MTKAERIAREVASFSHDELAEFRAWFAAYDAEAWDREIESDSAAGRFDAFTAEALSEHRATQCRSDEQRL
jgi:hypothetical protein